MMMMSWMEDEMWLASDASDASEAACVALLRFDIDGMIADSG